MNEIPVRFGSRDSAWPLAAMLGVAALVRVYAWSQTAVLFNDGPVFLALAEAIREGHWAEVLAHPYHPLYPFCIAIVSTLGLSLEVSAVAVSIFGGLLGIVSLYALLVRAWGRDIALMGAWVLTLHPWAIDFSSDVMSDGLYIGLYLAAFGFLAESLERPSWRVGAACGGLSALAFLTRPEGLGLVPIAVLLVGARALLDESFRSVAKPSLIALVLAAGIVAAPYVVSLSLEAGEWTWTHKKSVAALAQGNPVAPGLVERVREARQTDSPIWLPESASAPGAGQPSHDLAGVVETIDRVVRTSAASLRYEVLLFALLGVFALRSQPDRRWHLAAVGVPIVLYSGLLMLLVWGAGYLSRRHALAIWIPVFGVSALGWRAATAWILQRWTLWRNSRPADPGSVTPRVVCTGLVIVLAIVWGPRDLRERRMDRSALRAAAQWVAETHPDSGPIAAEKLRIAYYGEAPFVPLLADPDAGLEATLRASRTHWIVIDRDHVDRIPDLHEGIGRWIEAVHEVESHDRRALVFEIH